MIIHEVGLLSDYILLRNGDANLMTTETDELGFEAPAPLGHPGRLGLLADSCTGPEPGDLLPDFSLPNQFNEIVHYVGDRGTARSVVVFYRSTVW